MNPKCNLTNYVQKPSVKNAGSAGNAGNAVGETVVIPSGRRGAALAPPGNNERFGRGIEPKEWFV
jgi:hypothetical protein